MTMICLTFTCYVWLTSAGTCLPVEPVSPEPGGIVVEMAGSEGVVIELERTRAGEYAASLELWCISIPVSVSESKTDGLVIDLPPLELARPREARLLIYDDEGRVVAEVGLVLLPSAK